MNQIPTDKNDQAVPIPDGGSSQPPWRNTSDVCSESISTAKRQTGSSEQPPPYFFDCFSGIETGIPGEGSGLFRQRKQKTIHWSILWSDIMMTMFVLFLVMYVHKIAQQGFAMGKPNVASDNKIESVLAKKPALMETIPPPVEHVYESGSPIMRERLLDDLRSIELGPDQAVRIVLPGDLLFDMGRLELKPTAQDSLREIADVLGRFPYMVNVVGHTDAAPAHSERFDTNWELSALRACAVARFLIEEKKLPEERFYVSGYAHIQPVYTNDSIENRALNRRVEILITRDLPYGRKGRLRELPLGGVDNATGRR